eukprot:7291006-Ditylum_brightwellii.AAC.1
MNNDGEQYQEICDHMNKHNIDFFGCSEHNLDTTQHTVQYKMKNITHASFSSSSLQLSSSPIPAEHFYKPGGTLCITQGDINSCKIDQGADKYSRWSYVKFAAQNAT